MVQEMRKIMTIGANVLLDIYVFTGQTSHKDRVQDLHYPLLSEAKETVQEVN